MLLYFSFGMLQESCVGEVSCGVFILSFQVVRILIIFGILLFLNASAEQLRRSRGHSWAQLGPELTRLHALRALRLRLLIIYLVLPILFMFLEVQVLDWNASWFKLLWREALDIYLACLISWRVCPSAKVYAAHFAWVRPPPHAVLAPGIYPRFFRWLLGSTIDAARADAVVQAAARRREARRD
mmetsp:Transcript_41538/g.97203  ORF Transcript_41538/g.97203 Transcript_41538/m.97203 type:complete len:184 (-) Transcript_41538:299-850(-)